MELRSRTDRRVFIITHNDLDGVGAAASYLRIVGVRPEDASVLFAEPYNVDQAVERLAPYLEPRSTLAFMDIGYNLESTPRALEALKSFSSKDLNIEWYDHHVWAEEDINKVLSAGARLFIDRSTCGAGVVIRYASKLYGVEADDFLRRLESAVCAADLWKWDDPMAPKLFRASTSPPGVKNGEWKEMLVKKFFSGVLWDEELQSRLNDYLAEELSRSSKELKGLYTSRGGGCAVAAIVRDFDLPSDSIMGSMIISRARASAAALIKRRGFRRVSISLRSRGAANVQVVARYLGGGGHPRASGASMRLPLGIAILSVFSRRLLARYVSERLLDVALKTNACSSVHAEGYMA
jgi:hypothetical protein